MKRLILAIGLLVILYILGTFLYAQLGLYVQNASLILGGINVAKLDKSIRDHFNTSILYGNDALDHRATINIKPAYINTDAKKDDLEFLIRKNRNGAVGEVELYFQANIMKFMEVSARQD